MQSSQEEVKKEIIENACHAYLSRSQKEIIENDNLLNFTLENLKNANQEESEFIDLIITERKKAMWGGLKRKVFLFNNQYCMLCSCGDKSFNHNQCISCINKRIEEILKSDFPNKESSIPYFTKLIEKITDYELNNL